MRFTFTSAIRSTLRSLRKDRLTLITIVSCLSVAFFFSMIILTNNFYETSFDTKHRDSEKIYRIVDEFKNATTQNVRAMVFPLVAPTLSSELPEIENATNFYLATGVLQNGDKVFKEESIVFTQKSYFEIFSVDILDGSVSSIDEPGSLLLSRSAANRYFGNGAAVGQTIDVRNLLGTNYTGRVIGVFADFGPATSLKAEVILSSRRVEDFVNIGGAFGPNSSFESVGWRWAAFYTFVKAREGVSLEVLDEKVLAIGNRYRKELDAKYNQEHHLRAQPMLAIHTTPGMVFELTPSTSLSLIQFFYVVVIMLLAIAWVNYVNLAIAKSMNRARETGIRKLLGASRQSLILQFLLEALALSLIAMAVAMIAVFAFSDLIEQTLGKPIFLDPAINFQVTLVALSSMLVGSLAAGLYPAIMLASQSSVGILKGSFKFSPFGILLRRSLLFFQFFVALGMLLAVVIVHEQISFMTNSNIGVNLDKTLSIELPGPVGSDPSYTSRVRSLQTNLEDTPGVASTATASITPGITNLARGTVQLRNEESAGSIYSNIGAIDYGYIELFEMNLLAGKSFSENMIGLNNGFIINRKAAEELGFSAPEDALDQHLQTLTSGPIIGVIENFHQLGLQNGFEPIVLSLDTALASPNLNIKLSDAGNDAVMTSIEKTYKEIFPEYPFTYTALDVNFANQYKDDKNFAAVISSFSVVGLFVACMGLLGVSSLFALQRRKEIAVRKVLGSSLMHVFFQLNKSYIIICTLSFVISAPVAYKLMDSWLSHYQNRISIQPWMMALPYLITIAVVMAVTLSQTYKTATENPTKNLRE